MIDLIPEKRRTKKTKECKCTLALLLIKVLSYGNRLRQSYQGSQLLCRIASESLDIHRMHM